MTILVTPQKCDAMLGKFLQDYALWLKLGHECHHHNHDKDPGSCSAEAHMDMKLENMKKELIDVCGIKFVEGQFYISDNPLFTRAVRTSRRAKGRAEAEATAPEREPLPKVEFQKV